MKYFEEQVSKTINRLSKINWIVVVAMSILLMLTSLLQEKFPHEISPNHAAILYVISIFVAIVFIPLSSYLFNKTQKKIRPINPSETNLRIYYISFISKIIHINIGFVANLFLFYFSNNPHLLIIGAIYIVYQIIMIQNKDSVLELFNIENPQDKDINANLEQTPSNE